MERTASDYTKTVFTTSGKRQLYISCFINFSWKGRLNKFQYRLDL